MEKYEELANKIERAYQQLVDLMNEIGTLKEVAGEIENTASEIADKYQNAFNLEQLQQIKHQNKRALETITKDTKEIGEALSNIEILKIQTEDNINIFTRRIGNFEESLNKLKKTFNDIDTRLLKLLTTAERQSQAAVNTLIQASQLFDVSAEIEKYNKLLKIEQENNRLLKELHRGLNVAGRKTGKRNYNQKVVSNEK